MRYQGLIMDFGGVLTTRMQLNSRAFERAEGLAHGAYTAALCNHPDGVRVYADLEVGRATQTDWNNVIGGILGIDPTDLMRRALAHLELEPEIVTAVRQARTTGARVAMLSNSFGSSPFDPYDHLGVYDLIDVAVLSETEGVRKPDPRIYRRALTALGLPASTCVFVDDQEANLPPAQALGIHTVHHSTDPTTTAAHLTGLFSPPGPPTPHPDPAA
ncbi:HAD-IA family hydrolase [Actinocorallia sp. API 0066]|uniref:HAD-IA family hydrolase n=1 Tax=Actinocorallia sp. API 0066 TaxID=2896846 RepID=UPI001E48F040|nr:HAD-IA family hydrolase [Actinocorallia sp. API 0066]MCD0453000.1 HAD-IA family hydrolase [Actinocorallia sp. API 0066]